jgi:4-diphosphocytidyl-2-C-methyl-D-erythritol kinase
MTVRVAAPAKVNLYLGVGPLMPDGYHAVDTVLHALELHDDVRVSAAPGFALSCHPDVGVPMADNLACRAAHALGEAFGRPVNAEVVLSKRIPHGAGLGGGSSDAAAVIAGLARMWGVGPTDDRCVAAAATIGADVPFFLYGGAALMTGRGDRIERSLPALTTPVVLVRPPEPVPTAAAYRAFDAAPAPAGDASAVIAALEARDEAALGAALDNNLAAAAAAVVPAVADALAWVQGQAGVLGATVAGSGSAVFALVYDADTAESIAARAAARGWWSAASRLSAAGARATDEEGGA